MVGNNVEIKILEIKGDQDWNRSSQINISSSQRGILADTRV